MVEGGLRDVMVSNQVVGPRKIARLAALARHAKISVCVDDAGNVADLGAAAEAFGGTLNVLVEIEVGMGRCGVPAGEPAVNLAKIVDATKGLEFAGLQAYHGGAQHIRGHDDRRAANRDAAALTRETIDLLAAAGLDCAVKAGGGTGSLEFDLEAGVLNELQAGSYVFMDADYGRNLDAGGAPWRPFRNSLFVRATVMSAPTRTCRVTDAGLKALAFDSGLPLVHGLAGATYDGPSDEHGALTLADGAALSLGDAVMLIPGHCDPTVNLYDWYVGLRGDVVERVWPVAARGRLA
jgi:3-hydroxy-D-aspartate aldolase